MVEGERIPGEAAVRPKRRFDPLKAAATIPPRGQMQQRPPGAVDQGRRFLDFKLPYISFAQVELDSLLQLRALEPARASPAKNQSRPHAGPLPEQPGSQHARYQPQVRPVARWSHGQARRRTGTSAVTPVDHSAYRSAQASYQLDMATPIYAQARRRSAGPPSANVPEREGKIRVRSDSAPRTTTLALSRACRRSHGM